MAQELRRSIRNDLLLSLGAGYNNVSIWENTSISTDMICALFWMFM